MTCESVLGVFESVFLFSGSACDRPFYIVFSSRFLPRFACSNPSNTPSFLVYMHDVSRNTVHLSVTATRRMRRHAVADTEDGSKLHSRKLLLMIHRVDSCRPDLRWSLTYHGKDNKAFKLSRMTKKGVTRTLTWGNASSARNEHWAPPQGSQADTRALAVSSMPIGERTNRKWRSGCACDCRMALARQGSTNLKKMQYGRLCDSQAALFDTDTKVVCQTMYTNR
jgi:hypothetical protein